MKTVAKSVTRLLASRTATGERGTPSFHLLAERRPPWLDQLTEERGRELGELLGVLVFHEDSARDSTLVRSRGVVRLGDSRDVVIGYQSIVSFEVPTKEPLSTELVVHLSDGRKASFPVRGSAAFSLATFINDAKWADTWTHGRTPRITSGLHRAGVADVAVLHARAERDGFHVFLLSGDVADRASLFAALRPLLDPPVQASWDALSDALFLGLCAHPARRIAVVWPCAAMEARAPDDLARALEVFAGVARDLADPSLTRGAPKELAILAGS